MKWMALVLAVAYATGWFFKPLYGDLAAEFVSTLPILVKVIFGLFFFIGGPIVIATGLVKSH